ncbi:MAG TPA: amidase [Solirubrobacteraceae bacterium]|nr:amidase [Solirubrobacteraceae bacterium]
MAGADLLFRPVHELAALVRRGEVTARELVDLSLERIDALDGTINAFVDVDAERARAAAGAINPGDARPFAGVPVAIKNNRPVQGLPLTFGARFAGDLVAPYDHNVTRRLRAAGFVIMGTTALPEWGILPVSEASRLGPTRNPWDLGRTPGGSSGGSAAAVAAGMVPFAHGNDGGGSLRIPAACCGLVGLKPQRGRISPAPESGEQFLVSDGVLTRTVVETAALLDLLAGPELGDASWAPPPPEPFAVQAARGPDPGRRIALTTTSPLPDIELDPACVQAVRDAGALLESLGHEVVEDDPPWDQPGLLDLFTQAFGPAVATQIALMATVAGREPTAQDMEPLSWEIWQMAKGLDCVSARLAIVGLEGLARAIVTWCDRYDAVLTPALAEAPLPIGTLAAHPDRPMRDFARSARFTPYTAISNVSGSPAVSLPLYEHARAQGAAGVPLGIQLIGRPAGEGSLLALAAQLEAAHPWAARRPGPAG